MANMKRSNLSWVHPNLIIKKIPIGKGVFAKSRIRKGEIITIYGGYVFTAVEESIFPTQMRDFALQISPKFVIGLRKKTQLQISDYINHSCSPNTGFKGQIFVVAMKDIGKGEQITFDYCMVLSKVKGIKPYRFICRCGSSNCRKIITWNDWKNPSLQKKYLGYFQWYLEDRIRKAK